MINIAHKLTQFISRDEKPLLIQKSLEATKVVLRQKWTSPVLALFFSRSLKRIGTVKGKEKKLRVLALNSERFYADLEALASHPNIEVVALPSTLQIALNALWVSEINPILQKDRLAYIQNQLPEVQKVRSALYHYLIPFIRLLSKLCQIDAIVTCTYYYLQDRDWERAAPKAGVPFYVLHKENMKDPNVNPIERHKDLGFYFEGTKVFVSNEFMKVVLMKTTNCKDEDIIVVGTPRMDTVYQRATSATLPTPRKQIVLFSFHHRSGGVPLSDPNTIFSKSRTEGYVECFDTVHSAIAELAVENPDIDFIIKPKWMGPWVNEIHSAIKRESNLDATQIPNLVISNEKSAYHLIENSRVIVGFNSTTLLEAKLFGRPVVMPFLAEAVEKYTNEFVLFVKYLDSFTVARSKAELKEKIMTEFASGEKTRPLPLPMIEEYLAHFDGKVCDRIYQTIQNDLSTFAKTEPKVEQGYALTEQLKC